MRITQLWFEPGDIVRLKEDAFIANDPFNQVISVTATKGSCGVVTSFEEYRAAKPPDYEYYPFLPPEFQKNIKSVHPATSFGYPVCFEEVLPPAETAHTVVMSKAGDIRKVNVGYLEKLDYLKPKLIFILEQLRVFFPEESSPFQIEKMHKLLLIDFAFENVSDLLTASRHPPKTWLTPYDYETASIKTQPIVPIRLDAPIGILHPKEKIRGQIFFQVPERGNTYNFHIELPEENSEIGAVNKIISVLDLQPGDKVQVKAYAFASNYRYSDIIFPGSFRAGNLDWVLTQGSQGIIVPFFQYKEACEQQLKQFHEKLSGSDWQFFEKHCYEEKKAVEECLKYPILLRKIQPPSEAIPNHPFMEICSHEGEVLLVDGAELERIE